MQVWLDGEFVHHEEVCVPLLSHGFSRGLAVFDAMKITPTVDGPALLALDEHAERFFKSTELMHLELQIGQDELIEAIKQAARLNQVEAGACKIFAYYSQPLWGTIPTGGKASVAIYCGSYADFGVDPAKKKNALNMCISPYRKMHQETAPIKAKVTGYYVGAYLAAVEAKSRGYDEAIMADTEGHLCEGGSFSTFFVVDGVLTTPPVDRVLTGTTRAIVLDVARDIGLPVEERDLRISDLDQVSESFCTGSVLSVAPVCSIEGKSLGEACPGPLTGQVKTSMDQVYEGRNPKYRHWLTYFR